jgi:hypothetical protein
VVTLETAVSGMVGFAICQKHIDISQKPVAAIIAIEEPPTYSASEGRRFLSNIPQL